MGAQASAPPLVPVTRLATIVGEHREADVLYYKIEVAITGMPVRTVVKRYSEIKAFRSVVKKNLRGTEPSFPTSWTFGPCRGEALADRRDKLERWLDVVAWRARSNDEILRELRGFVHALDLARAAWFRPSAACTIQRHTKGWLARKLFARMREAVKVRYEDAVCGTVDPSTPSTSASPQASSDRGRRVSFAPEEATSIDDIDTLFAKESSLADLFRDDSSDETDDSSDETGE